MKSTSSRQESLIITDNLHHSSAIVCRDGRKSGAPFLRCRLSQKRLSTNSQISNKLWIFAGDVDSTICVECPVIILVFVWRKSIHFSPVVELQHNLWGGRKIWRAIASLEIFLLRPPQKSHFGKQKACKTTNDWWLSWSWSWPTAKATAAELHIAHKLIVFSDGTCQEGFLPQCVDDEAAPRMHAWQTVLSN